METGVKKENIKIIYTNFPTDKVNGLITETEPGKYMIYINTLKPQEKQVETLQHEIMHIVLGHYTYKRHLTAAEKEADIKRHLKQ